MVSLVMCVCRVLTLVHWPSDIVAWIGVGVLVPLLLIIRPIRYCALKYIINPLIRVEQWIVKNVFSYEQWDI